MKLYTTLLLFCATVTYSNAQSYSVVERGLNHRTLNSVTRVRGPSGEVTFKTNSYVHLDIGAHYQSENGEWLESEPRVDIVNGQGVANRGQHTVIFPANIRTVGGIELTTVDGKRFRSHVMGLAYTDAKTGQSILIAEIKDSVGQVVGNQVIYPDAFTDFLADVRYTYSKAGLEQDVVFLQRPPDPAEYLLENGQRLNPSTTRLEIFTEFVEAPEPQKQSSVLTRETEVAKRQGMFEPDLTDEFLRFGVMAIGEGRAFPDDASMQEERTALVGKAWTIIDQRTFLIEKMDYSAIRGELEKLPQAAAVRRKRPGLKRDVLLASLGGNERGAPTAGGLQFAKVERPRKGFVADYSIIASASNFTLKADTTYLVTNLFTLSGTSVIEPCVVKYTTNIGNAPKLAFSGTVSCQTGPGRPAFFVSKDDDTVGEIIAGSTGTPIGIYAYRAIDISNAPGIELHDLRIRNARHGVYAVGNTTNTFVLKHSQISRGYMACGVDYILYVQNLLLHDLEQGITPGSTAYVENVTFHRLERLSEGSANSVYLTNCLLVCVTNIFGSPPGTNNIRSSTDTGLFQTVGAAAHYLANGSTNRNTGTTNITPSLLAELRERTTYPPVVLSNHITSTATLAPQASRDTDTPDLGYHYDPLDYIVNRIDVSAPLTIAAGTGIGVYGANGSYGIQLTNGGSVVCEGTATAPCRLLRYNLVQEQADGTWAATNCGALFLIPSVDFGSQPTARFRFTEFGMPAAGGKHLDMGSDDHPPVVFVDCKFGTGSLGIGYAGANFTNCALDRVESRFLGAVGNFQNNLFYGGSAVFAPAANNFRVSDTLFDKTSIQQYETNGNVVNLYNGYVTNAAAQWLTNSSGNNAFTNTFSYVQSGTERFYQPTNSLFIGRGSTNANLLGFYHYTVLPPTDSVRETNSVVDIGFHRVALSGGLPVDSDGDGLADYLEDTNGDGNTDGTECCASLVDTDGDGVSDCLEIRQGRNPLVAGTVADTNGIINLRVYTPLK